MAPPTTGNVNVAVRAISAVATMSADAMQVRNPTMACPSNVAHFADQLADKNKAGSGQATLIRCNVRAPALPCVNRSSGMRACLQSRWTGNSECAVRRQLRCRSW
jgi:hypothetical protein